MPKPDFRPAADLQEKITIANPREQALSDATIALTNVRWRTVVQDSPICRVDVTEWGRLYPEATDMQAVRAIREHASVLLAAQGIQPPVSASEVAAYLRAQ